jgi:uncharacterized membrane protein SpoIIM required for sporulation
VKQQRFESQRRAAWAAYAEQLRKVRQGYRLADGQEADAFVAEYRRLARDLSVARARGYSQRLIRQLNELVVQGHNVVYAYREGFVRSALLFLRAGFPAQVRQAWPYMLASLCLFGIPLGAMVITIVNAPEWVYSVMSGAQAGQLEAMYDPTAEHLGRERQSQGDFMMFGYYIMNNISITFRLFASGLAFGLGTIFFVVFNGVYLGAATGHLLNAGYESTFFAFVVGHGAFELTALVIAGGSGLMLGHALIAPGQRGRLAALRRVAPEAVQIVVGAALMCLLAAFVEAFWSSSSALPVMVKFAVGAGFWTLVLCYLLLAGRRLHPDE